MQTHHIPIRFLAGLLVLLLVFSLPVSADASPALEQEAARLVNAERTSRGLAPLRYDGGLASLARIKSRDMAENRYFSHQSPTYGSPFAMMRQLGLEFRSAGENIARGFDRPRDVVAAWMASDSHRSVLLSAVYTTTGIGYINGHWTQWFLKQD